MKSPSSQKKMWKWAIVTNLKFPHFFLFLKTNEKQIFSLFLEFVVLHCLLKRLAKGIAKNHNLSFVSCPSFYLLLVYLFSSDMIWLPAVTWWWRPSERIAKGIAKMLTDQMPACLLNELVVLLNCLIDWWSWWWFDCV